MKILFHYFCWFQYGVLASSFANLIEPRREICVKVAKKGGIQFLYLKIWRISHSAIGLKMNFGNQLISRGPNKQNSGRSNEECLQSRQQSTVEN